MMNENYRFADVPWVSGGDDFSGADCVGIVKLFLRECGIHVSTPVPALYKAVNEELLEGQRYHGIGRLKRGDVLFFERGGELVHVGVWLGEGKFLHSVAGGSRIDNGLTLLLRTGAKFVGAISMHEIEPVCAALKVPTLGGPFSIVAVALIATVGMTAASLTMRPKIPNFSDQFGRYSANGGFPLLTLTSTEAPLPDLLGELNLAGNAVYQTPVDKTLTITDATQQKVSRVVVFATAPGNSIVSARVNNLAVGNAWYGQETQGAVTLTGIQSAQPGTEDLAVNGVVAGYATLWSSYTLYYGAHDITVPVDQRAKFDRQFPIYGFPGCIYGVFRCINATKFEAGLNVSARVFGHAVRSFTAAGFEIQTVTDESLAGADGTKVRFKMGQYDIESITAITVNGVGYTELSASNQAGNIYHLNRTKGFVEFVTAPAAAATILVSYRHYRRVFSQNPAEHIVYLLTEKIRGKGFDESKIDWAAAVALRDYCDENVTWNTARGLVTGARYRTNYVLDVRRPLGEHVRALLDACHAQLFLSGGKIVLKAKRAGSSVFSFNESNILAERGSEGARRSTFVSQLVDRAQRSNRVHVFYHAYDTFNTETGVVRDDPDNQAQRAPRIGNDGVVEEVLKYKAVDNDGQAERLAETVLAEDVNAKWAVEFKTNIKGLALEPTDLIDVTHSSQPAWSAKKFWIEEISQDENDHLIIRGVEYFEGAYV